ncbi:MAG: cation-translocating P-type ATPase [Ureaplasma sp.]|nr:cation-translocating P-type ATPase [Ureaplasma sp.]MDE7222144.1 cation-translocating P-type ATPase [Ureaplasma sp.]
MTLEKIETLPKKERTYWRRAIKVDPSRGLTPAMVRRAKTLYGSNVLTVHNAKPLWLRILEHFKELITILLCIAAIISLILGIIAVVKDASNYVEWLSLFLEFIVIVGIIFTDIFLSIRQSDKTDKALQALKEMSAPVAKVVRGGKTRLISAANVVPGDIIFLESGERIPADGKLISSSLLQVDESILTGESEEVLKDHEFESNENMQPGDRKDWVFSGTNVVNGTAYVRIAYTGMNTQIGNIAALLDQEVPEPTPLQKQITWLSRIVGIIAVSVCIVTFFLYMVAMTGYSGINFNGWGESLNVSVNLAIASIPETLLAVLTIILSIAARNLSKQHALVKQLSAIETLGALSVVCTDKTGTLTKNVMTVTRVWEPEYSLQLFNTTRSVDAKLDIFKYGTLCSDAQTYIERGHAKFIGDPTETAILKGYAKQGNDINKLNEKFVRVTDIPFDADRKMMSVVVPSDKPQYKYMIITKGAPDRILGRLSKDTSSKTIETAKNINDELGSNALRVLAVAVKYTNELPSKITSNTLEHDLTLVGLLGIIDPPRPEALVSVAELRSAGIRTVMITGDHATTAAAIAKELKILRKNDKVISGAELAKISDKKLAETIDQYSVFARVSPSDKLRIVNAWKANGKIVSMTGDGVNDAPSLKAANVGCAMGSGTDVAKDSSAIVLSDDNFATIVHSIDTGRRVMLNIKSALTMLLTANLANFVTIFLGILVFFISPIKSLQILFLNIAVETLLSFAIASNIRHEDVMSFKPRNPKLHIIDKRMLLEILLFGLLISGMSLFAFFVGFSNNKDFRLDIRWIYWNTQQFNQLGSAGNFMGGSFGGTTYAITYQTFLTHYNFGSLLSFLTIGLCLAINGLYARTGGSLFTQKPKDSAKMLLYVGIAIALIAFVSFVPYVNNLFNMGFYDDSALMKYANYNYVFFLPFAALAVFIIISEIYRGIFRSLFNVDGSRHIKGQIIEEENDEWVDPDAKKSKIKLEVVSSNTKSTTTKKTTTTKSTTSKSTTTTTSNKKVTNTPKVEATSNIVDVEPKQEKTPEKKLRVSNSRYTDAGRRIEELVRQTSNKVKTEERKKATNK